MCNGNNHRDDCDCGFGPPYSDHVDFSPPRSFAARALADPRAVRRALRDLNYKPAARARFMREYEEVAASRLSKKTKMDRLKELIGRRKTIEEDVRVEDLLLTLYRFGAPSVEGSSVTYREGVIEVVTGGWKILVEGVGMGPDQEMTAERAGEFLASDGACKEVFVKIPMRYAKVRVEEGGRVVARGVNAAVNVPKKLRKVLRGRGCRSVDTGLCHERTNEPEVELFEASLAGDRSRDRHLFEHTWRRQTEYSQGFKFVKFGFGVDLNVRVRRTRELRLTFRLPAGLDYRARICRRSLHWELPFG